MAKPAKPCDVAEYRDKLPCCNPAGTECWGEVAWNKARGVKPKKLRYMGECPHIDRVREWWARQRRA